MTRKRLPAIDTPLAPLNPPPTRAELSGDLVRLAMGMERVAIDMEYLGGFGELAAKGRELREAALIAMELADDPMNRKCDAEHATQHATERGRG